MSESGASATQLRHVARGAALGLAGSAFAAAAGFALAVVATRGLETDDAGRFFATTAVFALLVAASTFGTEAGLARFMLRLEARGDVAGVRRAVLWALVPTVTVAGALAVALVTQRDHVLATLGVAGSDGHLVVAIAIALPAAVLADVLLASTRGVGRLGPTVVVDRLVRAGLQVAVPGTVLAAGGDLLEATAGWVGAYLVSAPLAALAAVASLRRRAVDGPGSVDSSAGRTPRHAAASSRGDVGRSFWSFTWPRGVGALAQMGIQKADIVVVALLLTPADAALYAAATRFVPLGQMAVQALQQVLQPRFTAILLLGERGTLADVFRVTTCWSILLAWPLYLVVAIAPTPYLALFGERYTAAAPVVVLMGAAMLVAVATGPIDTLLIMSGRSGLSMINAVAALAVDLVLCLVLVPRWGITGAAAAWAVAVVVRCGLATWQVHLDLEITPGRGVLRAAALPAASFVPPLLVVSVLAGPDPWAWSLGCLAGLGAYALLLRRHRVELALDVLLRPWQAVPATLADSSSDPTTPPEERDPTCGLETPYAR